MTYQECGRQTHLMPESAEEKVVLDNIKVVLNITQTIISVVAALLKDGGEVEGNNETMGIIGRKGGGGNSTMDYQINPWPLVDTCIRQKREKLTKKVGLLIKLMLFVTVLTEL
jgi:hypothetical protein